jgi:hypothetical protein
MTWRKAWARSWDEVRYCSSACRIRRVGPVDRALEDALRGLLEAAPRNATVDPDDAVDVVAATGSTSRAELREPARSAARRLVAQGVAEVVERGRVVDPSRATGPMALRRTAR